MTTWLWLVIVAGTAAGWFVFRWFVPSPRQRAMIVMLERSNERHADLEAMKRGDMAPEEWLAKWAPHVRV